MRIIPSALQSPDLTECLSSYIDIIAPAKKFLWNLKVKSRQPVFHVVSRPHGISKFLPSKISIFMAKMTFEKIFNKC